MIKIISIIENNNYEKKITSNNKYIFVNRENNTEQIKIYYENHKWYFSFPIRHSNYNYKTCFEKESNCREYIRQILEYLFN